MVVELNHPKTVRNAIEMAGLDYTALKKLLDFKTGLNQDAHAIARTDTDQEYDAQSNNVMRLNLPLQELRLSIGRLL